MRRFSPVIKTLSDYMYWISGIALACIMLMTVADVVLRIFYRPFAGVYDLTMFLGGVVIGFAIPRSTWQGAHVRVAVFINKFPLGWQKGLRTLTLILGIFMFLLIGWCLFFHGFSLYKAKEVSLTIHLPFYPVVFGMGTSCFITSLVLLNQTVGIFKLGENHES